MLNVSVSELRLNLVSVSAQKVSASRLGLEPFLEHIPRYSCRYSKDLYHAVNVGKSGKIRDSIIENAANVCTL